MDLNRLEVFLEVAQRQSFAAAAKALGMTGPAASKQVMALEEELGVKLLHRTTRKVSLSDEGAAFYERAHSAMEELREAANQIQDRKASPRGTLKINAPMSFAHMHLLPVFSGFARKYPELALDITLDDRMVDMIAEGVDVLIRIGVMQDSTLKVKKLMDCPIYPVASPAYIHRYGMPTTPAELKRHRLIAYAHQGGVNEWRYRDRAGKTGTVRSEGVLRANTAEMMLQAALDGLGIAILPSFMVATHVQAGMLLPLLTEYETYPMRSISALMLPNRYRSAKVQLFVEWLGEACKAVPLAYDKGNGTA